MTPSNTIAVAPASETDEETPLFLRRTACPVCGARDTTVLYSAPYTEPPVRDHVLSHYRKQGTVSFERLEGVDFTVRDCGGCGLIFQEMAPEGDMLRTVYDEFIDPDRLREHEEARLTPEGFADVARRLRDLFEMTGRPATELRMLDYGFGYGRWARVAVAMGAKVFATEISPEKIAYAQSIGVGIVREDDLAPGSFDIVHAEQVFEHLSRPRETFARLAASLAPGGLFKFAVPRQGNVRRLLAKHGMIDWSPFEFDFSRRGYNAYNAVLPLEHVNSFTRKSVERLAGENGLSVDQGRYGGRHVDIDLAHPVASLRAWGVRLAKDLFVRTPNGRRDSGYYVLRRRAS